MVTVTLRRMTSDDPPALAALERESFSDPWNEDAFREELDAPFSVTLVAEAEAEAVGYLNAHLVFENAHINTFCVAPACRRQGVGRRLLEELATVAAASGAVEITLEVRAGNQAALALYRQAGFHPVGLRRQFYHAPVEDALILKKELPHD